MAERRCVDCGVDISARHYTATLCELHATKCKHPGCWRNRKVGSFCRGHQSGATRLIQSCQDCGEDISDRRISAARCRPCSKKRWKEQQEAWRISKRRPQIIRCQDCGVDISARAMRCKKCKGKNANMKRRMALAELARSRPAKPSSCKHLSCLNKPVSLGFCDYHYRRFKRGTPLDEPRGQKLSEIKTCSVENCDRRQSCNGLCKTHAARRAAGKSLSDPIKPRHVGASKEWCSAPNCQLKARGAVKGNFYCSFHVSRAVDDVELDLLKKPKGDRTQLPVGAKKRDQYGYVTVKLHPGRGGFVKEHRHVMEIHLGRPLSNGENVHHINGDRTDNNIKNLELWSSSQPPGQRVVDKLTWAREIVQLYGDLLDRGLLT